MPRTRILLRGLILRSTALRQYTVRGTLLYVVTRYLDFCMLWLKGVREGALAVARTPWSDAAGRRTAQLGESQNYFVRP